jgi:hypothetical protein
MLVGLVALGATLVWIVPPPRRASGPEAVDGPRVFRARRPAAVRSVTVTLEGRRLAAHRTVAGWEIAGTPPDAPGAAEAVNDLVDTLVALRAVDAFRPRDTATYGLDPPRGTIELVTARGTERLALGAFNAAGSALYARHADRRRVLQVGTYLLSAVGRVFYHQERAGAEAQARDGRTGC